MSDKLELHSVNTVLLLGATGGIGGALLCFLLEHNSSLTIYALTRRPIENPRVRNSVAESIDEGSLTDFLGQFPGTTFDLVINAIGTLEPESGTPEKSLRDVTEEKLVEAFRINAVLTPILAKVVRNHLSRTGCAFVSLSAMVGSTGENELGGWYSYRASKAALNAFVRNIAIEWRRSHPLSLVLALHPGTTRTKLSEKYSTHVTHKIHSPSEAAANICRIIFSTPFAKTGIFLNWDGRTIDW